MADPAFAQSTRHRRRWLFVMASARRLILRLMAGRCEICEGTVNLEVHHGRKLADLTRPRVDSPDG